ncbi:hypothetical protein ACFSJ3_12325 [Corallincola platygyrae]|uniref:Uncharacterized protein n=1 Tax=Corallincola platygyrae TaxID=1193278 RepID=A0ABW4XPN9_9GAMM
MAEQPHFDFKAIHKRILAGEGKTLVDQTFGEGRRLTLTIDLEGVPIVAKLFEYTSKTKSKKGAPWQTEHEILEQIQGVLRPKSYGFETWVEGDKKTTLYLREFIQGSMLERLSSKQFPSVARYLTKLHQQGITTNDPYLYNFIKAGEAPVIIDFGKATKQPPRSLRHQILVSRELFKIYRSTLNYDATVMKKFWHCYFAELEKPTLRKRVFYFFSLRLLSLRQKIRNLGRGKPMRS